MNVPTVREKRKAMKLPLCFLGLSRFRKRVQFFRSAIEIERRGTHCFCNFPSLSEEAQRLLNRVGIDAIHLHLAFELHGLHHCISDEDARLGCQHGQRPNLVRVLQRRCVCR